MTKEVSAQISMNNIFADLGFTDAEEMFAKAEIVRNISKNIDQLQIDHANVAELLEISQSEVSSLITGRLLHLPKDRLSQFLDKLNENFR